MKNKEIPNLNPGNHTYSLSCILAIVAGILGFALYVNTIGNGYVLDDNAITNNQFVQQGINGIPKLFTVDYWYFMNLKLGYYRPLALTSFAIEHQFFGNSPGIAHLDNALLYGLTGFILCLFLIKVFPSKHPAFSFLISMVFIAHPIHTEVVANIKSRDELLSLLNILAMMYFMFQYQNTKKRRDFLLSLFFFYLALLSKETAIVGIVLLPLFLYYSGISIPSVLKKSLPFLGIAVLFYLQKSYFLGLASSRIPDDIVNYPYFNPNIRLPTVFNIFAYCLKLLILPWPLSYDYSYNQVPASHWTDLGVWIGIVLFVVLAGIGLNGIIKRTLAGLGIAIIFITIIPSLAFVYLRGGIMAERFLYAPSLGFGILLVYLLSLIPTIKKEKDGNLLQWFNNNVALATPIILLCLLFSYATIARNTEWKDQITLFGSDTKHIPNSCRAHLNYGIAMIDEGRLKKDSASRQILFQSGLGELQKAVAIYPNFGIAYFEMGMGYQVFENQLDSAVKYYKKSIDLAPGYELPYFNLGHIYQSKGHFKLASYYYNKSAEVNPQFTDAIKSAEIIKKSTGLDIHDFPGEDTGTRISTLDAPILPDNKNFKAYFRKGTDAVNIGDFSAAIENFKEAAKIIPDNKQNLVYLANCYGMTKQYQEAVNAFKLILKQSPNDPTVLKNLAITYDWMGEKDKAAEVRKNLK
jgi:tetratricopeptide (TPR) repeat protein